MTAVFRASVVLDDLPDAMALARPPLVVVTVPGPVVSAVAWPGARRATARRSDLGNDGALLPRLELDCVAPPRPLICGELQWADDRSLDTIVSRARRLLDDPSGGDRLIAVWRTGARRPLLAELLALAAESGSVVEVLPDTESTLIAAGHTPEQAEALIDATGGLPELIAAVGQDAVPTCTIAGLLVPRLDVLAPAARSAAEALAFGASIGEHDAAALAIEGLVPAGGVVRMPGVVATVVRNACPAERLAVLVEHVVAHGDRIALAHHLLALGDRSPAAAPCYLDAARAAAGDEAVRLARAARESGAGELETRVLTAAALVRAGQPGDAVRELDGLDDVSAEPVRAVAWAHLGDPVAAATAFTRAGEAGWATVMCVAAAKDHGDPADDGSAPALLAAAVGRWRTTRFERPDDVLAPLATAARRQMAVGADADPMLASELAVRVAERLGEHAVAAGLATDAVDTAGSHRAHAELLAGWIEARRGVVDGSTRRDADSARLAPRSRLLRDAARCAAAVRDVEGTGLDAAVVDAARAASMVAPDLFDIDLRTDIAAAAERARANQLGDPISAIEPLVARCGPSHRFDLAWCRLQAALAGDRLERVAACARTVLALDATHDRHRLAVQIRALARIVADPSEVAAPAEVVDVARAFASAGVPHVAARLCGLVATATSDETTARLLLRESRAWRSCRTRVRRASGSDDAVVRLSDQEERIALMVLDGRTHKEIGAALFVSPKTVEHHVAHIRTKLGVTSRSEMMGALRDYLA